MELFNYSASVANIVDGDTCDLIVDVGFRISMRDRFRLLGINAPEMSNAPAGANAKAFLISLMPVGTKLLIRSEKPKDKYGRWLADLFRVLPDGSIEAKSVNQQMIDAGQAVPFMTPSGGI